MSIRRKMIWFQSRYNILRPSNILKLTIFLIILFFIWHRLLRYRNNITFEFEEVLAYPTLYQVYGGHKVSSGLEANGPEFKLNGIPIRIYSGAIHYFRVHPHYWRDRLKKLRASGFNTVETYVAWNLHEARQGQFSFDGWLDLAKYITIAKEEDLFVILRPGPYICSEWDFGGMPSWLLRDEAMISSTYQGFVQVRTTYPGFMRPAARFLSAVVAQVRHLQWSPKNGAQPIIATQIENEYTIFGNTYEDSAMYLKLLKDTMEKAGFTDVLFFTSDGPDSLGGRGSLPGVLQTVNFKDQVDDNLRLLKEAQPERPRMVMEFWTGWFDHWLEAGRHVTYISEYRSYLEAILEKNVSVNLYMFHGGTTFGFMPGGNSYHDPIRYLPDVNSYDYDALLTESGDYTRKYWLTQKLIKKYKMNMNIRRPLPPDETRKVSLPAQIPQYYITLQDLVKQLTPLHLPHPINMEALDINQGNGQSYGFILYRKTNVIINKFSVLKITGQIRDILYIIINGKLITRPLQRSSDILTDGYWTQRENEFPYFKLPGDGSPCQIDLLVENQARMNFGSSDKFNQKKGIWGGSVYVDQEELKDWQVYSLDFNETWVQNLQLWKRTEEKRGMEPALYKFSLKLSEDEVQDTFLKVDGWTKGQIFVNNFNLGRYWNIGPTKTSYIPAPLLKEGKNEVLLFELFRPGQEITFQDFAELGTPLLGNTSIQVEGLTD